MTQKTNTDIITYQQSGKCGISWCFEYLSIKKILEKTLDFTYEPSQLMFPLGIKSFRSELRNSY